MPAFGVSSPFRLVHLLFRTLDPSHSGLCPAKPHDNHPVPRTATTATTPLVLEPPPSRPLVVLQAHCLSGARWTLLRRVLVKQPLYSCGINSDPIQLERPRNNKYMPIVAFFPFYYSPRPLQTSGALTCQFSDLSPGFDVIMTLPVTPIRPCSSHAAHESLVPCFDARVPAPARIALLTYLSRTSEQCASLPCRLRPLKLNTFGLSCFFRLVSTIYLPRWADLDLPPPSKTLACV